MVISLAFRGCCCCHLGVPSAWSGPVDWTRALALALSLSQHTDKLTNKLISRTIRLPALLNLDLGAVAFSRNALSSIIYDRTKPTTTSDGFIRPLYLDCDRNDIGTTNGRPLKAIYISARWFEYVRFLVGEPIEPPNDRTIEWANKRTNGEASENKRESAPVANKCT